MTRPFVRWSNLFVIFRHEVRDQIRDRRTLFMIFVMPILLYPILGTGVSLFASVLEQKPLVVVVVGAEYLPKAPPLLNPNGDGFNPALFDSPSEAERLVVQLGACLELPGRPSTERAGDPRRQGPGGDGDPSRPARTAPGREGNRHPDPVQQRRRTQQEHPASDQRPLGTVEAEHRRRPAQARSEDAELHRADPGEEAGCGHRREVGGSLWSRLFPFLLVMMSLTGAFYPAIDLCAGEKERGTMETLLISPASRAEIVLGKFLTVMLASVVTALLNLLSMGLTGLQLGPPGRRAVGRRRAASGRRGHLTTDASGRLLDGRAADPPGGVLQRGVPVVGRAGPEHERRPVLHDAALPDLYAADLPDPDARNRAQLSSTAWFRSRALPCS